MGNYWLHWHQPEQINNEPDYVACTSNQLSTFWPWLDLLRLVCKRPFTNRTRYNNWILKLNDSWITVTTTTINWEIFTWNMFMFYFLIHLLLVFCITYMYKIFSAMITKSTSLPILLFARQNWKWTCDKRLIRSKEQQWWQALAYWVWDYLVLVALSCTVTYGMQPYLKLYCVGGNQWIKSTGKYLQ